MPHWLNFPTICLLVCHLSVCLSIHPCLCTSIVPSALDILTHLILLTVLFYREGIWNSKRLNNFLKVTHMERHTQRARLQSLWLISLSWPVCSALGQPSFNMLRVGSRNSREQDKSFWLGITGMSIAIGFCGQLGIMGFLLRKPQGRGRLIKQCFGSGGTEEKGGKASGWFLQQCLGRIGVVFYVFMKCALTYSPLSKWLWCRLINSEELEMKVLSLLLLFIHKVSLCSTDVFCNIFRGCQCIALSWYCGSWYKVEG